MKTNLSLLGLFSVIGANAIWSTSFVTTKLVYEELPPVTVAAIRFLISVAIIEGFFLFSRNPENVSKSHQATLYMGGILGIAVYFILENVGLYFTTSADAALIVASFPAITAFLEFALYRRPISLRESGGMLLAVLGVALIAHNATSTTGSNRLLGDLMMFAAGVVWAFYNFSTRSVVKHYSMMTVMKYQNRSGFLLLAFVSCFEIASWRAPSFETSLILIYLGSICSLLAYFLYAYGLRHVPATTAVATMNLVPVLGTLLSVLILREHLFPIQMLGGMIVILGIVLSTKRAKNGSILP